jgi:glycosyltransferase involved in cell wall biosynthesis
LKRKQKFLPKGIKLVGISNWLSSKAKESYLFRDYDIRTISNNIDIASFFPVDKSVAKKVLGIQTDKKIVLCGAYQLASYYKGFSQFINCLDYLDESKYFLCFFGQLDESLVKDLGFEYNYLGYLNDIVSLRIAYSCADVFLVPSLMDAFAKTLAEAMACGTPSVCFDATGPKDIITHQIDGYKAAYLNAKDLANGVEWVVNHPRYDKLCETARKKTCKQFDNKVIARKYIGLYKEILEQNT